MIAGSQADIDREVTDVARALHQRGSTDEAIALLRGALSRDPAQGGARELMLQLSGGEAVEGPRRSIELGLSLCDAWVRRGMLVEALALLGGTPLGSGDMGREWANLLGELLAPVPVDAEATLVEMHRQLLTGGASVALTLLEERDRDEPALPAWATRRLELLRWMLLDNAASAPADVDRLAPSLLAAKLSTIRRRGLTAGLNAMRELLEEEPEHRDGQRVLEALEALQNDIDRQASLVGASNKTMPMHGHTAAIMQVRMGNLDLAHGLYEKLIEQQDDDRARLMLASVEVVQRALAGESLEDDELAGEATVMRPSVPGDHAPLDDDDFADEATVDEPMPRLEDLGKTTETRLPESPPPPEKSGKIAAVITTREALGDHGPTTKLPSADRHAEALVAQGRLEEAEDVYRGLAEVHPERRELAMRADELRQVRLSGAVVADGVVVRVILPVE